MYCTSTQLKLFSEQELIPPDVQSRLKLPQPYCDFMKTYGDGTYGGVICFAILCRSDLYLCKNK